MLLSQFQSLINGSQFQAGTNQEIRSMIWREFVKEFPENVWLTIDGKDIEFKAQNSVSGKSTSYFATITKEIYVFLLGSEFGLKKDKMPYLTINGGVIEIHGGGKFFSKISNQRVSNLLPF